MKIRCWLLLGLVLAELGLSRISSQAVPVTQAAGGYQHTLFLKSDGSLWAMGANSINGFNWGQLGNGTYTTTNSPQLIVAAGVTALAAGGSRLHPHFIEKVTDAEGNVIYRATHGRIPVLDPAAARTTP